MQKKTSKIILLGAKINFVSAEHKGEKARLWEGTQDGLIMRGHGTRKFCRVNANEYTIC